MLKGIEFSNVYNFIEPQKIEFNSKSNAYVIIGDNGTGKTNLLDIIDNVGQSLYRKPNYDRLKTVVNQNSGSSEIWFKSYFNLNGQDYYFEYIVDVEKRKYVLQRFVDIEHDTMLFNYKNNILTSDVLSDEHIAALSVFNLEHNGVFIYAAELDKAIDTNQLRDVYKRAKYQDYVEFDLNDNSTMDIIKGKMIALLNNLGIDVREIDIHSSEEKVTKEVQKRLADKRKESSIKYNQQLEVNFKYDNYTQNIKDESRGTIKIFDLCTELYATKGDEYFVPRLIDEMSTSLSSNTFFYILDEFMTNTNRQLVFTSNNLQILEDKTLPKESVIFVEKTDNGSVITKLSDYKFVRNDKRHNWKKLFTNGQLCNKFND